MAIPVLNQKDPTFAKQFKQAMHFFGCARIVGHNINDDNLGTCYCRWKSFFEQSEAQKMQFDAEELSPAVGAFEVGYFPLNSEKGSTQSVQSGSNRNEYFHSKKGVNASFPAKTETCTEKLMEEGTMLATVLFDILTNVGNDSHLEDMAGQLNTGSFSPFRALNYPAFNNSNGKEPVELIKEHTDKSAITIVYAASGAGLQVKDREGMWHQLEYVPGSVIVQAGESLQIASGGYYHAGIHCVVAQAGENKKTRQSFAQFFHIHPQLAINNKGLTPAKIMHAYFIKKGLSKHRKIFEDWCKKHGVEL